MGWDIGIELLTVLMFGSLAVLLLAGLPLSFVTGGLACIFLFVFGDAAMLNMLPSRIFPLMTDYQLSAIPLFIFMASVLERAGVIERMFDVIYRCLGGLKGGLATAAILASTVLAAMCGVIGATEVTMGLIALPAMLKRNYDVRLASGAILGGGTLGILIPPSILAILFAVVAQQSVGELFLGAVIPGLLLSSLYIAYVTVRCYLNPALGPALDPSERITTREKLVLLRGMAAPITLVALVLGVIFTGIATPVEAAGIGTFGALIVAGNPAQALVGGAAVGRHHNGKGLGHGALDRLRSHHVRRLLRRERRSAVRLRHDHRHGSRPLRHPARDDDDPRDARHVPRLGRHSPAGRAHLPADREVAQLRRDAWPAGRRSGRRRAVVSPSSTW